MPQDKYNQFLRELDRHPLRQIECWGVIGRGYPGSLYKLFVRFAGTGTWWHCERSVDRYPRDRDPREMYERVPALNLPVVIAGRLELTATLSCQRSNGGLVDGLTAAHQRLDAERRGRRILDAAPRAHFDGRTTSDRWSAWRESLSSKDRRLVDWLVFLDRVDLAAVPALGDSYGLLGGVDVPDSPSWRSGATSPRRSMVEVDDDR